MKEQEYQRDAIDPSAVRNEQAVAYLHRVVNSDGEFDQALSFSRDSFPLERVTGYKKVSVQTLVLAQEREEIELAFEDFAEERGFPLDCHFFNERWSQNYYESQDTQLAWDIFRAGAEAAIAKAMGEINEQR